MNRDAKIFHKVILAVACHRKSGKTAGISARFW